MVVENPDVLSLYSELEALKDLVSSHSNHLGMLQNGVDLALTYLKVFAAALGVNLALMGAVIALAIAFR